MTIMIPFKKDTDRSKFLNRFFGEDFIDDFVNRPLSMLSGEGYFGRANVSETAANYQLEIVVPGIAKEDIDIKVSNERALIVKLDVKETITDENKTYIRKEFAAHTFERHFALPEDVTDDGIEAEFKDGILILTLNKIEQEPPEEEVYRDINIK